MSIKDFFSKKQKPEQNKSTKIGGSKTDSSTDFMTENTFADEDFAKNDKEQLEGELTASTEANNQSNINLEDIGSMSIFTNKYDDVEDFEKKLNDLSPLKGNKEPELSFSLELDETNDKPNKEKEFALGTEDNFDLGTSILDIELEKSESSSTLHNEEDKKQSIINEEFKNFDSQVDENTLMALYEEDAREKKASNHINKKTSKIGGAKDEEDLLKSQLNEINVLFGAGALADEQDKEDIQEKLDVVAPEFHRENEIETQSTEELEIPSKHNKSYASLGSLGQLDAALDVQTISSVDATTLSYHEKQEPVIQKKKYSSIKNEQYKKSIFGNMSVKTQYLMFGATLCAGLLGLGSSVFFSYDSNNKESRASKITALMGGEAQQFHSSFRESLIGVTGSYKKMSENWDTVVSLNKTLGQSVANLRNPKMIELFESINHSIGEVSKNVEYVKSLESVIKDASAKKNAMDTKIAALVTLVDRLGLIYMQTGANQAEMSQINLIKNSLKNINGSVSAILVGESVNQNSVADLNSTKDIIQNSASELFNGSANKGINKMPSVAVPIFNKFVTDWKYLGGEVEDILTNADELTKAKGIAKNNSDILNSLSSDIKVLSEMYDGSAHGYSFIFKNILIISILLLIISLAGLGYVYRFESERKGRELKIEADKNKKSVNKLLNEMVYLQTGNLTKKTTIEEGITQDIADSVNATIDSLVVVVTKIKNSSLVMKQKTNEINLVSTKLLDATEKQSDSIVEANESINNIAQAIHQISEKTKESLITAQHSAEASNLGARQVKESIESMNAISKNMEETVVLMKKVSDSSKQISEVISLLSDITEETNILALNATVQAAKAGEAGKGFKVVADSIQELADNAAEATRRVGALIATVQTDIQSVGSSIERTNQEVERGVELSENAGESLNEITDISNKLADIVKSISRDANTNAEAARQISSSMSAILKTTEETKDSTKKTTNSITEIDKMSSELSESVKTFIVP
jgi:twitching motility protein PilJ